MRDLDADLRPHRTYAYLAAALFAGVAITEIVMIAAGRFWPRFSMAHNHVVMGFLAALWIFCAAALLVRRRAAGLARAAWVLSVVGVVALFAHSVIGLARVYLPLTVLQIFLLGRALKGSEWRELTRIARHEPTR